MVFGGGFPRLSRGLGGISRGCVGQAGGTRERETVEPDSAPLARTLYLRMDGTGVPMRPPSKVPVCDGSARAATVGARGRAGPCEDPDSLTVLESAVSLDTDRRFRMPSWSVKPRPRSASSRRDGRNGSEEFPGCRADRDVSTPRSVLRVWERLEPDGPNNGGKMPVESLSRVGQRLRT